MDSKKMILAIPLLLFVGFLQAQPFAADIAAFKKQDGISFPPKSAILFVGSSSFTNWKTVSAYFPGRTIINRGFGGSSLTDVIFYARDIIVAYQPKQVVIYCGENDLAASDTVSANTVYLRFLSLYNLIEKQLPGVHIAFISLKPSPSRWHLNNKMLDANSRIKAFLSQTPNGKFIDVYRPMLGSDGKPKKEIFLEDGLHMNHRGYTLWQQVIEPYLLK